MKKLRKSHYPESTNYYLKINNFNSVSARLRLTTVYPHLGLDWVHTVAIGMQISTILQGGQDSLKQEAWEARGTIRPLR